MRGSATSGLGALLIAVVAVTAACITSPQSTNASPKPSPSTFGALPAGRAAFFYSSGVYAPLQPIGWDGTRYAPIDLGKFSGSQAIQSPDGTKLIVTNVLYDRVTGSATTLPFVANKGSQMMWADDNAHICVLYPMGESQQPGGTSDELDLIGPDGASRVVAQVGHDEAQAFGLLRACSVARDEAIVAQRAVLPISDVWVVKISTGKIIGHLSYAQGSAPGTVVASPDATWIAAVGSTTTDVAATDTGVAVAHVKGHAVAFSGDGNVLVLDDRVVEWRTDHTLWLVPTGFSVTFVIGEPGGSAAAVDLTANQGAASSTPPPSQLWLVTSAAAIHIADGVVPSFVTSL